MVGIGNLDYDDYLMPIAWIFFTAMSIMAHIVSQSGDNANMTDEYRKNISAAEAAMRVRGSKAFIVGWFTYTGMLWTLKICMLFFFKRVTTGLKSAKFIKPIFYAVIMLLQAQLPLSRKIMLFLLLCAGIFVMIAAILRVVFVFKNADAATPAIWACRETLVAMLVSNAPLIRPLLSSRWWRGEYGNGSKPRSSGYPTGSQKGHIELESQKSSSAHIYSPSGKKHDDDSSSTEHIVQPKGIMGIRVQRDIDVVTK
ncbi:uncharacterized protein N0V89_008762 [Didymosphaeria variabile]|uniref:Rhodopsin domain-containing protein n=1 Tax=Didymosphaeria variabile TaxID=1932322 RepID=A0A9W8XGC6_9PLEO|nr:uncharacterized protein N0V89_008762 [Didymosphaeria variabile]KAJ4350141.1 hypothetical protein N0V89_008762 [Didymosphaeria variabile]